MPKSYKNAQENAKIERRSKSDLTDNDDENDTCCCPGAGGKAAGASKIPSSKQAVPKSDRTDVCAFLPVYLPRNLPTYLKIRRT